MIKQEIKNIEEFIYLDKLSNGLDIYMLPNNKVDNFYCTLSVNFGSVHTEFNCKNKDVKLPNGVAHFLEHLLFNMPDGTSAFDYFSLIGGRANASTSFKNTTYEVDGNSNFEKNLSFLLKYVYTPYFTKEIVEREKGIIIEEIKMIDDNPNSEIFYGLNRNLFVNNNRKNLIAGKISDIKKITLKDIETAYEAFYHPENMFLVITGNFNPKETLNLINKTMKDLNFKKYQNPIIKNKKEPNKVKKEYEEKEMFVDSNKVSLGIKIPKSLFKDLNINNFELSLYLNLIFQSNFDDVSVLREKLINNEIITGCINNSLLDAEDHFIEIISAQTKYPEKLLKEINNKLNNLELTKKDIIRKTNSTISNIILFFDYIYYTNSIIQNQIINEKKCFYNIYDYYKSLNLEMALNILNKIPINNTSTFILKPKSD